MIIPIEEGFTQEHSIIWPATDVDVRIRIVLTSGKVYEGNEHLDVCLANEVKHR